MSNRNYGKRDKRYVRCMGRKPKTPREPYGEWLTLLRSQRGMTQEYVESELGKALGKPHTNSHILSHWERTGKLPGRDIILALCKIYNCRIESLLGVQRTETGYEENDLLFQKAKIGNETRSTKIKDENKDPNL